VRAARWAIVVAILYGVVLAFFVFPLLGAAVFPFPDTGLIERYVDFVTSSTIARDRDLDVWTMYWIGIAILVVAQALLLFVVVDRGPRLQPRQHVLFSVLAASLATAVLTVTAFWSVLTGIFGDAPLEVGDVLFLGSPLVFWALWGIVFYVYRWRLSQRIERLLGWLIKGSILELLIAIPAHIVTRQRDDCCAPGITLVGIGTGFAIMLMAFGPGVYLLYRRRVEEKQRYKTRSSEETHASPD